MHAKRIADRSGGHGPRVSGPRVSGYGNPKEQPTPIARALARLAGRVEFDERNGCYRLDGRPIPVQALIKAAENRH